MDRDDEMDNKGGVDMEKIINEHVRNNCLSLPGSRLDDAKVEKICEWIKENGKNLKYINLFGNNISSKGTIKLFNTLSEIKQNEVETIDLSGNDLNDECMGSIGGFLNNNNSLRYLGLKDESFTDEGIKQLDHIVEKNDGLLELDLSFNKRLSEDCVQHLVNVLNKTQIRDVFIEGTRLYKDSEKLIRDTILTKLNLPLPKSISPARAASSSPAANFSNVQRSSTAKAATEMPSRTTTDSQNIDKVIVGSSEASTLSDF